MGRKREWLKEYFPHTDQCGQDGKSCLKEKCKCWLGEKKCWDRMFDELVEEIFNVEYGGDYIYFRNENNRTIEGVRHVHFRMGVSDRDNFEEPMVVTAEIGFNSQRLAEKVQKKFQLTDWSIQGRCEDGGDDHDLVLSINGNYENKEKILDLFNFVQRLIPNIILYEQEINTCSLCKNKCEALTEYGERAICGYCERRIINENLENYFK